METTKTREQMDKELYENDYFTKLRNGSMTFDEVEADWNIPGKYIHFKFVDKLPEDSIVYTSPEEIEKLDIPDYAKKDYLDNDEPFLRYCGFKNVTDGEVKIMRYIEKGILTNAYGNLTKEARFRPNIVRLLMSYHINKRY